MNLTPPTTYTYVNACIIGVILLSGMLATFYAMRRWPRPGAPILQRIIDGTLVILLFFVISFPVSGFMQAFSLLLTGFAWKHCPQAMTTFVFGLPALIWMFVLICKSRPGLALVIALSIFVSFRFTDGTFYKISTFTHPPTVPRAKISAVTFIQAQNVPNVQINLSGIDVGTSPYTLQEKDVPAIAAAFPAYKPIQGTVSSTSMSFNTYANPDGLMQAGAQILPLKLSLTLGPTPLWLQNTEPEKDPVTLGQETGNYYVTLSSAEAPRQYLPALAWSQLNTPDGQKPVWWPALSSQPLLFWEGVQLLGENTPAIDQYRTWLVQQVYNQGQTITPQNASQVLDKALPEFAENGSCLPTPIATHALTLAAQTISADDLAHWFKKQGSLIAVLDFSRINRNQANAPRNTAYVNDYSKKMAASYAVDFVLVTWARQNRQNLPALAQLGTLIGPGLLANYRADATLLLGGPAINQMVQRLMPKDSVNNFTRTAASGYWEPNSGYSGMPFGYYNEFQIYLALPGPVGDRLRTQDITDNFSKSSYIRSYDQNDSGNLYKDLVYENLCAPAAPSSREYLPHLWERYASRNSLTQWSARRTTRIFQPTESPIFEFNFLSRYINETRSDRYISIARRVLSPRFEQTPEDFIEEVGQVFDDSVRLPKQERNRIWADLVADIIARHRTYGLAQKPDKSKINMDRPIYANQQIKARAFALLHFNAPPDAILFTWLSQGALPDVPMALAADARPLRRCAAIDLAIRMPTPANIAVIDVLAMDADPAVVAKANAARKFIAHLKTLPSEKLPAPFTPEACTFFDLERFSK